MDLGKRNHSRSRWEVTRERLHIGDSRPPPPDMQEKKLGDLIPGLMKRLGLEEAHWINTLDEEWPDLMGTGVAAHSRPGELAGKRLTVYVDSSVWLYELSRTGRTRMLNNLKKRYGPSRIQDLRFQLDPEADGSSAVT